MLSVWWTWGTPIFPTRLSGTRPMVTMIRVVWRLWHEAPNCLLLWGYAWAPSAKFFQKRHQWTFTSTSNVSGKRESVQHATYMSLDLIVRKKEGRRKLHSKLFSQASARIFMRIALNRYRFEGYAKRKFHLAGHILACPSFIMSRHASHSIDYLYSHTVSRALRSSRSWPYQINYFWQSCVNINVMCIYIQTQGPSISS